MSKDGKHSRARPVFPRPLSLSHGQFHLSVAPPLSAALSMRPAASPHSTPRHTITTSHHHHRLNFHLHMVSALYPRYRDCQEGCAWYGHAYQRAQHPPAAQQSAPYQCGEFTALGAGASSRTASRCRRRRRRRRIIYLSRAASRRCASHRSTYLQSPMTPDLRLPYDSTVRFRTPTTATS